MPTVPGNKRGKFMDAEALATERGRPVPDFPIEYEYHTGPWRDILDLQIELIQSDVRRARADNKLEV